MMPSTNTRQDTTVLMYLKVSLISMVLSHGGGGRVRRWAPAVLPALGICGGADDRGTLALDPVGQEVLVGGVIISSDPRSGGVALAGGNLLSSPWTPATPQARISATRTRPHRVGRGCMLLPAPVSVRWPLRSFQTLADPTHQAQSDERGLSSLDALGSQLGSSFLLEQSTPPVSCRRVWL